MNVFEEFQKEYHEEDGNFFFVKQFNEENYQKLVKCESSAMMDLKGSGNSIRGFLEDFMKQAMDDEILHSRPCREGRRWYETVDYENRFRFNPQLHVDADCFHVIRQTGNTFCHKDQIRDNNHFSTRVYPKTYEMLCEGLANIQKMLWKYYFHDDQAKLRNPISYDRKKQPFGDKKVITDIPITEVSKCERQVLCVEEPKFQKRRYYLLKIYNDHDTPKGTIREQNVLSELSEESQIVNFEQLLVNYQGEAPRTEKKRIIAYDLGETKPLPLCVETLHTMNQLQKLTILKDITEGVYEMHRATPAIYHRNLTPSSVMITVKPNKVIGRLVGFEYSKIDGANFTQFGEVKQQQVTNPNTYISQTYLDALENESLIAWIDWAKEDGYSLGALCYFILTEKNPPSRFTEKEWNEIQDENLRELVMQMTKEAPEERASVKTLKKTLTALIDQLDD